VNEMNSDSNVKLEKEFNYFLANLDELVKKYNGKYLVIKDNNVLGSYDDPDSALRETIKTNPLGTFLMQRCEKDKSAYTQVFHSRVTFN
jgi:hypothetical protein